MMMRRLLVTTGPLALLAALGARCLGSFGSAQAAGSMRAMAEGKFAVSHSDAEWHRLLSADQYAVLREAATEYPYSSPLLHEERKGVFACAGCSQNAFSSTTKFDSGTGWPSFWAPIERAIGTSRDTSLGMIRTAVHCSNCGGHLGHVFNDGPAPTGERYCMNGVAMNFKTVSA